MSGRSRTRWACRCRRSPTRGLGMSASTQSRSIIACSSGACSGVTSRAASPSSPRCRTCTTGTRRSRGPTTPIRSRPGLDDQKIDIRTTTRPTKSPPRRNITSVIRAVSPASPTKRECAMVRFSLTPKPGPRRRIGGVALGVLLGLAGLERLRRLARLQRRELGLDVGGRAQCVELAGDVVVGAAAG